MLSNAVTSLCETNVWARLRALLIAPILLALSACGGGGGSMAPPIANQGCNSATCGTLMVGLTDADGDFLSYSVDVVSLSLRKADGTIVQTLPTRQRVDFAQLVDLTELVTAATIPNGDYVRASIRLDYAGSEVSVEVNGAPVAATVVDSNGVPLGVVDLAIELDNRNHIIIAPGRPALLQLDFDLAASHEVDITTTPVTAVALPFIVATVEPVDDKELRVRGPLVSVNTNASSYLIDLRPFNDATARLGQVRSIRRRRPPSRSMALSPWEQPAWRLSQARPPARRRSRMACWTSRRAVSPRIAYWRAIASPARSSTSWSAM